MVAHGMAMLRSLVQNHFQMTLSEVSNRSAMTRAGARRYLLTLVHLGYAEQSGRLFQLTPKVLELRYAFMSTRPLAIWRSPISTSSETKPKRFPGSRFWMRTTWCISRGPRHSTS